MSLTLDCERTPSTALAFSDGPDLREPAGRDQFGATLGLRHAGPRRMQLRYEWQGPEDAPLVLVAGGISANRHLGACGRFPEPGWWPRQAGAGLALDSRRFRLLAIDWIGAEGELDAPIDSADQADAIAAVLDRIGARRRLRRLFLRRDGRVAVRRPPRPPARLAAGDQRRRPRPSLFERLARAAAPRARARPQRGRQPRGAVAGAAAGLAVLSHARGI